MDDDVLCELEVPLFIELKQSAFLNNDLGAFSTVTIGADQFIGNFKGKTKKSMSQCGDQTYVWAILSSRQVPLFYIDASDPKDSNWLRFIRTTSDANRYNVICMQQNQQINYFTSKEIKLGEELVTYLPNKKKKNRNKNFQNRTYKLATSNLNQISKIEETSSSSFSTTTSAESNKEICMDESLNKKLKTMKQSDDIKQSLKDIDEINIEIDKVESKLVNRYVLTDLILNILKKNEKITKENRILKCNLCSFISSTLVPKNKHCQSYLNELKLHYLKTHMTVLKTDEEQINDFKCSISNYDIEPSVVDLMNCILSKVEALSIKHIFKCHICKNVMCFNTEQELAAHLSTDHSQKSITFNCLFCVKEFTKIPTFFNHLKSSHKEYIISTLLVYPISLETSFENIDSIDLQVNDKLDENTTTDTKDLEIDNEDDSNSIDSSATLSSSLSSNRNEKHLNKPHKKVDSPGNEKDDESMTISKTKTNFKHKVNKVAKAAENNVSASQPATKTWTCQMCKKQFEQRVELNKHQCIELNLKLLKKKKDIRKKKWREAHWKRKIDLSYIETTSLTQLSQNIADNLSFCIDGTNEDLKAYSREVKDYINTELGDETQVQMFLKCCFPDVYKKLATAPAATSNMDSNLVSKANSYFVDSVYIPSKNSEVQNNSVGKTKGINSLSNANNLFNCKNCRVKCRSLPELIQHQREQHNLLFKTTFDCYNDATQKDDKSCLNWFSSNMHANSPKNYFACDPFAYVLNLHWDQTLQKKYQNCNNIFPRIKYSKHVLDCENNDEKIDDDDEIETSRQNISKLHYQSNDLSESNLYFKNQDLVCLNGIERNDSNLFICSNVIEYIITTIENEENMEFHSLEDLSINNQIKEEINNSELHTNDLDDFKNLTLKAQKNYKQQGNQLRISSRLRRSSQKKIEAKYLKEKISHSLSDTLIKEEESFSIADEPTQSQIKLTKLKTEFVGQSSSNNRKSHSCEKCGLEFTSANSVIRHQEKSCLRVKVINLKPSSKVTINKELLSKKKCPICGATFYNTHRVSIHIYKHHRNLLGSALLPPTNEAKNLHEIQLKKSRELES